MIAKVCRRGADVSRLLGYLFREGLAGEHGLSSPHSQARVVAAWDGTTGLEPACTPDGRRDVRGLTAALNAPLLLAGLGRADWPTARPVYHLALSAAEGDRLLTDQDWGRLAADCLHRTGLAPTGDPAAVRWVAVRHAAGHVHVVATLARQDGRRVWPRNDFYRLREACRAAEARLGLQPTSAADRTGPRETTRPELRAHREQQQRAVQAGRPVPAGPAREVLRRRVRAAAGATDSLEQFVSRLERAGTMVRLRYSQQDPGQVTGYAVALPGYGDEGTAGPVWFGGGKLAADLTLPQLHARWSGGSAGAPAVVPAGANAAGSGRPQRLSAEQRAAIYTDADDALADATRQLHAGGPGADDIAWAAADTTAVLARVVDARIVDGVRRVGPTSLAADALERAARPRRRTVPAVTPASRRLRATSSALSSLTVVLPRESRQVLALLSQVQQLMVTVSRLRAAQGQAAQATAALAAAAQLDRLLQVPPPMGQAGAVLPPLSRPGMTRPPVRPQARR